MGQREDVGKERRAEKPLRDILVQGRGKSDDLHEALVPNALGFKGSMKSADAAGHRISLEKLSIHGVTRQKDRYGVHRNSFGLHQRIQLCVDIGNIDESEEISIRELEQKPRSDRHLNGNGSQGFWSTQQEMKTIASVIVG